jgi:hypothetical protein
MITKFGKRFITKYIAGNVDFSSKVLAVGIANDSEYSLSDSNSRLGFEIYKVPVTFGSIDIQTENNVTSYYVIYKATLPQDLSGVINELGLYMGSKSSGNKYDSQFLSSFEDNLKWVDSDNYNPIYVESTTELPSRIGNSLLKWSFINGFTNSSREFYQSISEADLSGYSPKDSITLAFNRADSNSEKIRIKFYTTNDDYYYVDTETLTQTGEQILEIPFSNITPATGTSPSLTSISKIGLEIFRSNTANNAEVYFDGLRINDEDTFDPNFGLISRSILTSSLEKTSGRQVDIEYKINLGFN